MIWDFKRRLYCAAERVSSNSVGPLNDPGVQQRLQEYFDGKGGFPALGADAEYAAYFEAMYPDEGDRRRYIERQVTAGNPSLGHLALAALLHHGRAQIVWTPNFDRLIEDAVAKTFGTVARLTTATIDNARLAREALNDARWPLLVKLHGDFQSLQLKNTSSELQDQEAGLEAALVEGCRRYGLAVVGYSGRDASILGALERALETEGAFPRGLFWLHRGPTQPNAGVVRLIERARTVGVDARIVHIETFDELMFDVLSQCEDIPQEVLAQLDRRASRLRLVPLPEPGTMYPVIRLNALPVVSHPSVCRLVECAIGGAADVMEAVRSANGDLIVGRRKVGVLAFGADTEVYRVFDRFRVQRLDIHDIQPRRLRYDSIEHGMLTEAIARAFARERPISLVRRRRRYLLTVDPGRDGDTYVRQLTNVAGGHLKGTVPNSDGREWVEALAIRLDQRLGQLWLLIEPTIWIVRGPDEAMLDTCKEFVRQRLAGRYNPAVNALLDAWIALLTQGADSVTVSAFDHIEGANATFTIRGSTGFSRRTAARLEREHQMEETLTSSTVAATRNQAPSPGRQGPRAIR